MMLSAELTDASRSPKPSTVLVVEDEVLVRGMVAEFLRDQGYTVIEAADAVEALAVLEAGEPVDLVFSDVQMPGPMDGAMLDEVVRLRFHKPVLLTSGDPIRSAGTSPARAAAILPKPYDLDEVVRRIEAMLDYGLTTRR